MSMKLYQCKPGDRFLDYVVLDQEQTLDMLHDNATDVFDGFTLVVRLSNGEVTGLPDLMEVEIKE